MCAVQALEGAAFPQVQGCSCCIALLHPPRLTPEQGRVQPCCASWQLASPAAQQA